MACLVAKPIVNGIEKDLKGKAEVIRLNILDSVGGQAAERYDVGLIPATIVIGPSGDVVHKGSGMPDRDKIVGLASAL